MADSEVRQKWDAFLESLSAWKIFRLTALDGFEAGMRAGEIAQREFVIDLLGKRITRILEVGCSENDGEDYGQSHCFHLMEIQRILRGQTTCGVYDDYGKVPAAPEEKKP